MKSTSTRSRDIVRSWHKIDVAGQVLGRSATRIASILMGKGKPNFVRHLDCGDFVVVVNAMQVKVTGKKETTKLYSTFSGYPGGLKQIPFDKMRQDNPTEIIRHAVYGMLPDNKLRAKLMKRLYIYADDKHQYKEKFKPMANS